jgi:signal peptidase I
MAIKNSLKKWLSVLLAAIFVIPVLLNLFGVISMRIVLTESMSPKIQPGDLVVSANWEKPTLNDVAIYHQRDILGNVKQDVVHRVITITAEKVYQFKGDHNKSMDALPVPEKDIVGTVVMKVPGVGNLFTVGGLIAVLAIAGGIWAISFGVKKLKN